MKHSGAPQTGVGSRSRSRTVSCKCDAFDGRRFQVPECIIHLFVTRIPVSSIITQALIGRLQTEDTTGLAFKCDGTFVPKKTNRIVLLFKPH